MMKSEFEKIAGYKVSDESYSKIIEPMYMATEMSKYEFVKTLNRKFFEVKEIRKPDVKRMLVRNRLWERMTPNGCYYYVEYVDLIDIDIATGKFVIAPLDDETLAEISRTSDLNLSTGYDFDYSDALDKKRKPIKLWFE